MLGNLIQSIELSTKLQRGRARAGAECSIRFGKVCSLRGFNGAAPARARNAFLGLTVFFSITCFNGAAPARARNGQVGLKVPTCGNRFNGAAPARARNASIVSRMAQSKWWLQRGRARAGAECGATPWRTSRANTASTGPRPRGRGMTQQARVGFLTPIRFNGAAPARARNGKRVTTGRQLSHASTGPRPRGRGMGNNSGFRVGLALASTGPRPRGRGMSRKQAARSSIPARLQRGRARAGAEWRLHETRGNVEDLASTGPRPRGRGMQL